MLSRRLGIYQWLSLLILMTGVALVQVQYPLMTIYCLYMKKNIISPFSWKIVEAVHIYKVWKPTRLPFFSLCTICLELN